MLEKKLQYGLIFKNSIFLFIYFRQDTRCHNLVVVFISTFVQFEEMFVFKNLSAILLLQDAILLCIFYSLQLKPFQMVGLNWLKIMHTQELNGILADEMVSVKCMYIV